MVSFGPVGPDSYLDYAKTAAGAAEVVAEFVLPPIEWTRWVPSDPGRTGLEIYPQFMGPGHIRLWHGSFQEGPPDRELGPQELRSFEDRFKEMLKIYSARPPAWRRLWAFPGPLPEDV